ncbi:MAG: tryptophan--tRNA ligase [Acidimicrobiia bacterium]
MARVFSGIKPTGEMQLGNYVGAVRRWVADQRVERPADAIYCVVDLHAMTVPYDPVELTESTRRMATVLLAAGIDPDRSLLFVQSQVPQHTELCWVLNNVATFGELRRMTQFKDKSAQHGGATPESVTAGLFDYPVLMAADILLYDTDEVPIGDDQRQHLELSRDLALRFNHRFGDTFVVPTGTFPSTGARIMDLQDPTSKMSKTAASPQGTVLVLDDPKILTKKIKSAVTDSGSEVRHDPTGKPGISNLLEILAAVTDRPIPMVEAEFAGSGYGAFKTAVAEAIVESLRPVRERYETLARDPAEVDRILTRGAERAEAIASEIMARVRRAAGLLTRT